MSIVNESGTFTLGGDRSAGRLGYGAMQLAGPGVFGPPKDPEAVQNHYNVAHRADDALIDRLARSGIAYVPFFPLGGFTPLQSSNLSDVASRLGATPMQVALAWLLRRSPNILLIPGTSCVAHLKENLAAAQLALPEDTVKTLDEIGAHAAA